MTVLVTLLTLAVVILGVLVVGLLRAHGAILRHLHELGMGLEQTPDPGRPSALLDTDRRRRDERVGHDLTGVDPSGDAVGVRVVGAGQDTLLVFLSSGCTTCEPFWQALARPGGTGLRANVRPVVVTQGPEAESPAEVARRSPPGTAVVMSSQAWVDHDVPGSPFVVLVEAATGRVRGSGTGETWEQVVDLLVLTEAPDAAPGDRSPPPEARGPRAAADRHRERELDGVLLAAGIEPGDPSLYLPAGEMGDEDA